MELITTAKRFIIFILSYQVASRVQLEFIIIQLSHFENLIN